jgi:hypothetical protein
VSSFQVLGVILAGMLGILAGMVAMAVYQIMKMGRTFSWAGVAMMFVVLSAAFWIARAATQGLP